MPSLNSPKFFWSSSIVHASETSTSIICQERSIFLRHILNTSFLFTQGVVKQEQVTAPKTTARRALFMGAGDDEPSEGPAASPAGQQTFSDTFLDKVRRKEAEKNLKHITRSNEDAKRLRILRRLLEIVRMLPSVFVSEKTNALKLDLVCERLSANYPALFTKGKNKCYSTYSSLLRLHRAYPKVFLEQLFESYVFELLFSFSSSNISSFSNTSHILSSYKTYFLLEKLSLLLGKFSF